MSPRRTPFAADLLRERPALGRGDSFPRPGPHLIHRERSVCPGREPPVLPPPPGKELIALEVTPPTLKGSPGPALIDTLTLALSKAIKKGLFG